MTPDWSAVRAAIASGRAAQFMAPHDVAAQGAGLVYLATPYSAWHRAGLGPWAARRAAEAAERFARLGVPCFAPIVIAEAMLQGRDCALDPLDDDFWTAWCAPALRACDCVVVADVEGWEASFGCAHEAREALRLGKPLWLMSGVSG